MLHQKHPVIILGAGLAGLSAAYTLKKNGVHVVVLEARDRIGGRVWSVPVEGEPDLVVELGAEWIGKNHKRLLNLCKHFRLKLANHNLKMHLIYNNKYYKPDEWRFSKHTEAKLRELYSKLRSADKQTLTQLELIDAWHYLRNNHIPMRDLELIDMIESTNYGESIRYLSSYELFHEHLNGQFTELADYYHIEGGNSLLPHALAEFVGYHHIHKNHIVTSVRHGSDSIKIHCENGSVWEASTVICTLPTTAMNSISWHPVFPEKKAYASQCLNYCRIIKTSILFSERFWKNESFEVGTDLLPHFIYHSTQNQKDEKGVLTSYATGDKAYVMSQMTPEARRDAICDTLKIIFGDVQDKAKKTISYYWGDDPYTQGAYAIFEKNDGHIFKEHLKQPHGKILFAGEHLADLQGFMEGAVETGERAAFQILNTPYQYIV